MRQEFCLIATSLIGVANFILSPGNLLIGALINCGIVVNSLSLSDMNALLYKPKMYGCCGNNRKMNYEKIKLTFYKIYQMISYILLSA